MSNHLSIVLLGVGSLALLGSAIGCSQRATDEAAPSRAQAVSASLVGAAEDTTNTWSVGVCQGPLTVDVDAGKNGVCRGCTGTLIAPNLVLTARHCLRTATDRDATNHYCSSTYTNDDVTPGGTRITTAPTTRFGTPIWHDAKEILVPSTNKMCDDDIALVVLKDNVPNTEATPIGVDVWRDLAKTTPSEVAIVGRGYVAVHHGPSDAGPDVAYSLEVPSVDVGQGLRRKVEHAPFICIGSDSSACKVRDRTDPGLPNFDLFLPKALFKTQARAVYGDSGAGVIDQASFTAGKPSVIGVFTYFGVDDDGESRSEMSVRVDTHRSFLVASAQAAATAGGYAVPSWAKAPEETKDAGPKKDAAAKDAATADAADDEDDEDASTGTSSGAPTTGDDGGCNVATSLGANPNVYVSSTALLGLVLAWRRRSRKNARG